MKQFICRLLALMLGDPISFRAPFHSQSCQSDYIQHLPSTHNNNVEKVHSSAAHYWDDVHQVLVVVVVIIVVVVTVVVFDC